MRQKQGVFSLFLLSPSSRRAWIEMTTTNVSAENRSDVALLAEGVDRNRTPRSGTPAIMASPSSRRAWIEILYLRRTTTEFDVALLAEGVDRNISTPQVKGKDGQSPSSRRAWIEINAM